MRFILICITLFFVSPVSSYDGQYSNKNKRVFFINLNDGESVTSPVTVKFGINGMNIVPAGVDKPTSGHHHLLINLDKLPDMSMPIPADKNHLHFGKGQTETSIELPKGKHTLQLLLGNHIHIPHKIPLLSEKIEIIVE
jgi:hypothetical protein|tara:strand:+ start:46 stop:462 length:417 start_codon:yes stop_codon:yes gene_type:complete